VIPFWTSRCGLVETYVGDCLNVLRNMPGNSVHCCVTSPPYYGLRDYGTASWEGGDSACDHLGEPFRTSANVNANTDSGGDDVKNKEKRQPFGETCGKCGARRVDQQIGLEKSPAEFIANLVAVFREVRRVLHPSGTAWVNMGDSYANDAKWGGSTGGKHVKELHGSKGNGRTKKNTGLKQKDLMGMPWMLAFALRDDGWYLRQDIIWAKPSPMPESVVDRCTKSHEYVFLLAKNPTYFYDHETIKERSLSAGVPMKTADGWDTGEGSHGTIHRNGREQGHANGNIPPLKNRRSVWNVASAPYAEAHFATYPPELIRPMIRAGTSEKGVCSRCLSPWVRVTEKQKLKRERPNEYVKRQPERPLGDKLADAPSEVRASASARMGRGAGWREGKVSTCSNSVAGVVVTTRGWQPSCKCEAGEPVPATVIDIFGGSGTSGMVARQEGRRCILIELNPKYAALHRARVEMAPPAMDDADAPLFMEQT
jgi:DNA modification methylase